MSSITRVCLVRHGETDWNLEKRIQGSMDIPLNAKGVAQAQAAAQALGAFQFDALYSSDLARAAMTAQPIAAALGLAIQFDARWQERDYGVMQGLNPQEADAQFPQMNALLKGRKIGFDPAGGETLAAFVARVSSALAHIADAHRGQQVLVVAHGHVLDVCYRLATGQNMYSERACFLKNASMNWICHDGAHWRVEAWAQTDHLVAADDASAA